MKDSTYQKILDYFRKISEGTKWDGHLFAVGGCVRDEILGSEVHDVDIAVDVPNGGVNFAMWLLRHKYLTGMPILFKKFGTAKLTLRKFPQEEIEVVQTRAEKYTSKTSRCPEVVSGTIKEDCFRRDFTVNTLYRNIKTGEILDMTGRGVHDIKEGIIRTPLDPYETFDDDPVRILRCLRFAARFGWKIDEATMEAVKSSVDRLAIVSRERWSGEFRKMLMGKNVRVSLGELCRIGGLKYMNPLIAEMADKRIGPEGKSILEWGIEEAANLEEHGVDDPAKRYAAFFSRVGMLRTEVKDKNGVIRYPRHEHIGGNMAAKFLKHIGVEPETANQVKSIIQEKDEVRHKTELKEKQERHKALLRQQNEMRKKRRRHRRASSSARSQSAGVSKSTDLSDGMT